MLCGVLLALGSVAFTTNDVAACGAPFFPDDYEFSVESRGQVALLHFRADRIDIHTPLLVKTEEGATQALTGHWLALLITCSLAGLFFCKKNTLFYVR